VTSTNAATIGARDNGGSGGEWFVGDLDEVRLYNRTLTPAEIALLAR
jgi:hypothetical protein